MRSHEIIRHVDPSSERESWKAAAAHNHYGHCEQTWLQLLKELSPSCVWQTSCLGWPAFECEFKYLSKIRNFEIVLNKSNPWPASYLPYQTHSVITVQFEKDSYTTAHTCTHAQGSAFSVRTGYTHALKVSGAESKAYMYTGERLKNGNSLCSS